MYFVIDEDLLLNSHSLIHFSQKMSESSEKYLLAITSS